MLLNYLVFSPSFNTSQRCLKTVYSNERPLLGSGEVLIREGALIKTLPSKGGEGGCSFERGRSFEQIRYIVKLEVINSQQHQFPSYQQ